VARRRDPKEEALAAARCLNPHPEQVTDAEFLASDFCAPRGALLYRPHSGQELEEVFLGLVTYS
jgi:hypothetical protein